MPSVTDRIATVTSMARASSKRIAPRIVFSSPATRRVGQWWQVVTPLGRVVLGVGLASWVLGWLLGWRELLVFAAACLAVVILATLFVAGPASIRTEIALEPTRVVAGDPAAGQVTTSNRSGRRSLPCRVEVPVGAGVAVFDVGSLAPGDSTEELIVIPTERRGVIPVGPAKSFRADPIGLLNREVSASAARELIVHPHTTALDPFGSGLLRDLEGLTSKDLTASDLAFHALREYSPGDDRRYVHWRSSAKAGRLLVRQFQETRRSTICVVVDGRRTTYGSEDEFETALEAAGSLVMRACRDGLPSAVVAAGHAASGVVPHVLLDALSRAEMSERSPDLAAHVTRAVSRRADISFGVLVGGSGLEPMEIRRAAARFSPDVNTIAIRVDPAGRPGIKVAGRVVIVEMSGLGDLPGLIRAEAAA